MEAFNMNQTPNLFDASLLQQVIRDELALHPLAEPVDIYKLLFQSVYGPGHIISDIPQATESISKELRLLSNPKPPYLQNLDTGFGYMRLNLAYLLQDKEHDQASLLARCQKLAHIMVQSTQSPQPQLSLADLWKSIHGLLIDKIQAPEHTWIEVEQMAVTRQLPSHSNTYKTAYNPHYRVIKLSEFKKGFML